MKQSFMRELAVHVELTEFMLKIQTAKFQSLETSSLLVLIGNWQ